MSANSAVTYTSARSWSIPSEDPYEEAAQQLLEQAPHSPEYVPDPIELENHVPAHIPEHPEDFVPTKDEAPIKAYILEVASAPTHPLPPSFLSLHIRPPHTRAAIDRMRAAVPSTYHSLLPSGTPSLLPIPLPVPSTSRRAEIPEANTPSQKRLLLTAPKPGCEVGESSAADARQPGLTMARSVDSSCVDTMETRFRDTERRMITTLEIVNMRKDRAAVRAEIEVLRRGRLAYEQESIQTRKALARSEAYSKALEVRVAVLETQAHHHEWQRQTTDDFAVQHIMRTQALKAGARIDTLEDTGVAVAMAEAEASRVRNGYDSNGSGTRLAQAVRECTYLDFLKCQPLNFKGTEGVVGLTQWFEKIESALPWKTLKKMMTDKYCPMGEIKKLKTEMYELKTKGTYEIGYSRRFQELALMCDRMFLEESDRVGKYISGLLDMIHDSVKATRPKTMQEAIEFATELMDKRI
nr:hypothetical protein [Tanacetum cinerariifolium]